MVDRRVSVVSNAIGFELYSRDGRPMDKDGQVHVTDEESAIATAIAERVVQDLDEFDRLTEGRK